MKIKNLILNTSIAKIFSELPTYQKVSVGALGFFLGRNLISSVYSKVYNFAKFDSMHSGKENNLSYYSNAAMTDFGSGWKGLSKNVLKLMDNKNSGMGSIIKETITPFTNNGVNLGKTIMKMSKRRRKGMVDIKDRIYNVTLDLFDKRNIGHIVS